MELYYFVVALFLSPAVYAQGMSGDCMDVTKCQVDTEALTAAQQSMDTSALKDILQPYIDCLKPAIEKCKNSEGADNEMINNFSKQLETYESMLMTLGGTGGAPGGAGGAPEGAGGAPEGAGAGGAPEGVGGAPREIPSNPTCGDMADCSMKLGEHLELEEGVKPQCLNMDKALTCVKQAMEDCKKQLGSSFDEQIENATKMLANAEAAKNFMCANEQGGNAAYNVTPGEIPENPSCMDMQKCMAGMENVEKDLSEADKAKVCKGFPARLECATKSLKSCMDSPIFPKDQLGQIKKGLETAKQEFKKHCGDPDGVAMIQFSWLIVAFGLLATWKVQRLY